MRLCWPCCCLTGSSFGWVQCVEKRRRTPYIAPRRKLPTCDRGTLIPTLFNKNFTRECGFKASYEQRESYDLIFMQGEVCRARGFRVGGDFSSSFGGRVRFGKQQCRRRRGKREVHEC